MSIHRRWALILAGRSCQTHDPNPGDLLPRCAADTRACSPTCGLHSALDRSLSLTTVLPVIAVLAEHVATPSLGSEGHAKQPAEVKDGSEWYPQNPAAPLSMTRDGTRCRSRSKRPTIALAAISSKRQEPGRMPPCPGGRRPPSPQRGEGRGEGDSAPSCAPKKIFERTEGLTIQSWPTPCPARSNRLILPSAHAISSTIWPTPSSGVA
jgi:hypothetical protein